MTKRLTKSYAFMEQVKWELAHTAKQHNGPRYVYFITAKAIISTAIKAIIWISDLSEREYQTISTEIDKLQSDLYDWYYNV